MRFLVFTKRNLKELIRDPLSLVFCIGLPLFVLIVMEQFNIPSYVYAIQNFAPSIAIFGFSFISLFSGMLIAKDRASSFLIRLFASPMSAFDYIAGYSLDILPIAILQSITFFVASFFLGLEVNLNVLLTILALIPVSLLFIALGILLGILFNDKQVSGITSILIQIVAWTSGMWFGLEQVGKTFRLISKLLPFSHAVDLARACLNGNYSEMIEPFIYVILYTAVIFIFAVILFKKKMHSDKV